MIEKEENIVKKVCKELNITQKELAEMLDVPQGTVNRWASSNDIPKMAYLALTQMIKLKEFEEAQNNLSNAFKTLLKIQ